MSEARAWFSDLYRGVRRQSLWVKISETTTNSLENTRTTVGKTVQRISTPENAESFLISNKSDDAVLWLGDSDVTADNGYPLYPNESLSLTNMNSGDGNEIYGLIESDYADSIVVYSIAQVKA